MANAVAWMNDPDVTEWLLVGDHPVSRLAEQDWFEQVMRESALERANSVGFAIELRSGEHIGFSGIHEINYRHGTAISGMFIGRKDLWRQGLGVDAARVRTRYCFDVLGLRLLLSSYLVGNEATPGMLGKVGYRECGRVPRRYWKRGRYRDHVLLCLERSDWKP